MALARPSGREPSEDEFVAYYTARGDMLRRTAYVLCGDWHSPEDLTQVAFTKLYRAWRRIERRDVLDQYARQVLLRTFLDQRRRPSRREVVTVPDSAEFDSASCEDHGSDERVLVRNALMRLSKRRRAVLVLRFWADLSVEDVAGILECPVGTVKSQTARGLAELREMLGSVHVDLVPSAAGVTA